jgi:hypothetical protein
MSLAHLNHLFNYEFLKIRFTPASTPKRERPRYCKSHKAIIGVVARTCEEGEVLAFVVSPFVLASNNISDYSSEHFKPPRPRI